MALTPVQLQELNARIGWLLDKHLAPIFKSGTQLTFIARTPGNDNADVLVTTERDLNDVIALALRSLGRAAVGEGVDTVARTACVKAVGEAQQGPAPGRDPVLVRYAGNGKYVPADGVRADSAEPGIDALMLLADGYATASEEVISEQHSHPGDSYKNLHPARNKARADLKAAIQRALGVGGTSK